MVRLATAADAEQLNILNNKFNGKGETSAKLKKAVCVGRTS